MISISASRMRMTFQLWTPTFTICNLLYVWEEYH